MSEDKDFLDEIISERSEKNPAFPRMVETALRERELLRELAESRKRLHVSQTTVAAFMGTSQSAVARLERGESDPRLSTIQRYAAALGKEIRWHVADTMQAS